MGSLAVLEMSTVVETSSEPARTRTLSMVSVAMTMVTGAERSHEAEALVGVHNPIPRELKLGRRKADPTHAPK